MSKKVCPECGLNLELCPFCNCPDNTIPEHQTTKLNPKTGLRITNIGGNVVTLSTECRECPNMMDCGKKKYQLTHSTIPLPEGVDIDG